jgi:hypothetical protein
MEQLLVLIIEVFFEILLNVLGNGLFDWPTQGRARSRQGESIVLPCICWFLFAAFLGWLSLFVAPHALIALPALRMANLVLAPVVTALISWWIADWRSHWHGNITPRYYLWKSFWFTLGMVLVRFAYTVKD